MAPRLCLVGCWHDWPDIVRRALLSAAPYVSAVSVTVDPSNEPLGDLVGRWCAQLGLPAEVYPHARETGGQIRTVMMERGEVFAARVGATHLVNLDADDELRAEPGFEWPDLGDCAALRHVCGALEFPFPRVFRVGLGWRWHWPLHELPLCNAVPVDAPKPLVEGLTYVRHTDGERESNAERYARHAGVIEEWLVHHPDDTRMTFYLAQSYRDAGRIAQAIAWYGVRATMSGSSEERAVALYERAQLRERRGDVWAPVLADYLAAHELAPHRAEPLIAIATHYHHVDKPATALLFAEKAWSLPAPTGLFVERDVYEFRAADLVAVSAARLGHRELADCAAAAARAGLKRRHSRKPSLAA